MRRDPAVQRRPLADEQAAVEWLETARRRLFPTTAERDERGQWTATQPNGRTMLETRRDLAKLRAKAEAEGAHPGEVIAVVRGLLADRGLTYLLGIIDRQSR